jgi:hypothetical protein
VLAEEQTPQPVSICVVAGASEDLHRDDVGRRERDLTVQSRLQAQMDTPLYTLM